MRFGCEMCGVWFRECDILRDLYCTIVGNLEYINKEYE